MLCQRIRVSYSLDDGESRSQFVISHRLPVIVNFTFSISAWNTFF